MAEGKGSN